VGRLVPMRFAFLAVIVRLISGCEVLRKGVCFLVSGNSHKSFILRGQLPFLVMTKRIVTKSEIFRELIPNRGVSIFNKRRMRSRNEDSEKQSITGYEIMILIRPSFARSAMTARLSGYEGCIVSQDANTLPLRPHRR